MAAAYRTAVVTGATSGIGRAMAVELAKAGIAVGVTARRKELLDDLVADVRGTGGTIAAAPADVTDRAALAPAVRKLEAAHGPTDLLIANAGLSLMTDVGPLHVPHVERIMAVNFHGVINAFDAVLPDMLARRAGHLVAISSLTAYKGMPRFAGYCASKAAVSTYCEALRIELRKTGVAVTTVCPGFIDTPMTQKNEFRMPMLLTPDQAAHRILWAIRRRKKVFDFPWPMRLLMQVAKWAPDASVAKVAAKKRKPRPT
jgi:short-subunit dehydrogenase